MNKLKKIFSIFLLSFLLITPVLSQEIDEDQIWKIHVNDFSGGQNSFDISNVIKANEGVIVKNAILNRRGRMSKRKGVNLFATDINNEHFYGIGRFTPNASDDFMVIMDNGGFLRRSTSAASWVRVNIASPMSVKKNTEFVQTNKLLFIYNGVDFPTWYDGTTFHNGEDNAASSPIAKYPVWFKNYLFVANGSVQKDWVWFSNNLEPATFTEGDVLKVNTGDGQEVLALKPFKNNELIIYKERSVWLLDITGVTPLVDWTLQPIIEDIGLIAPRTVVMVGNDQWFLSSESIGVRSLIRTNLDKIKTSLVSRPIQDLFDGTGPTSSVINKTHIHKAAATFFDNKYIIALPSGVSTVNDLVLVYDLIVDAWYQITGWFVEDWIIFDNKLYFIDSTDGRVLQAFQGNNDQASGPVITINFASGPTSRGIDLNYESKAFDFESPELFKLPDALEVTAESSGDYDLEVFINLDSGGFQSIGTMSLAGVSSNLPQNLPFTLSSEELAKNTFDLERFDEFKEIQIGFDQSASDELVEIRNYTIFGKKRRWRREE